LGADEQSVMTDNLKRLLAFWSATTCATLVINAAEPWQVVTINKVSLEGALKEGTEFEVRIESQKLKESSGKYFGATDRLGSVVSEMTVKLRGEKVSFPKEAFEDLANALLQTVSITSNPAGGVRLRFAGGDGSTSYEAEYFIESNRLIKRAISYFDVTTAGEKSRVVKTTTF
jgi:hypothetical protein